MICLAFRIPSRPFDNLPSFRTVLPHLPVLLNLEGPSEVWEAADGLQLNNLVQAAVGKKKGTMTTQIELVSFYSPNYTK